MSITAWDSPAHPAEYDYLAAAPRWLRKQFYERFNEIKALPIHVSSIVEVGCATGELARYLMDRYPGVNYTGFDVSLAAIERARQKCQAEFICGHFQDYDIKAELVICRDVVHHQPDPWQFLKDLYGITTRLLIVRLRTGPHTINRWQLLYEHKVPYWILSQKELEKWAPPGFLYSDDTEPSPLFWLRSALWIARQF